MIDVASETLLTLSTAANSLPGGRAHVSTVWRWAMRGCKGVRLETVMRGGTRMTSREALERFFAATTSAADGHAPPARTASQREKSICEAERQMADFGL